MRKIIGSFLLFAAAAALCGCSGQPAAQQSDNVTIVKLMKPENIPDFYDVLSGFSEEHPDIRVKFTDAPCKTLERHGLYVSAMEGRDSSVDIYWLNDEWIDEFAKYEYIKPFDDDFEIAHDGYIIDTKSRFEYDGRLYALPIGLDTDVLFYRNDIISQPPKRWTQLEAGNVGVNSYTGEDAIYNIINIQRAEACEYAQALELYKKLITDTDTNETDFAAAFKTGRKAMFLGPASDFRELNSSSSAIRGSFSVTLVPPGEPDKHFIRAYGLGINANSENTEEAKEVLNYLKTVDAGRLLARSCSVMPVIGSLYNDEMVLYDNAHFGALKTIAENSLSYSSAGIGGAKTVRLNDALKMYLAGSLTADEAGEIFNEEINNGQQ